jgi:hypothetical protein
MGNTNPSEYAVRLVRQGISSNMHIQLAGRAGEHVALAKIESGEVKPDLDRQLDIVNRADGVS